MLQVYSATERIALKMQFLEDRPDIDDIIRGAVEYTKGGYRYSDVDGIKSEAIVYRIMDNRRVTSDPQSLRNVKIYKEPKLNQLFWDYVLSKVLHEQQSLLDYIERLIAERDRLFHIPRPNVLERMRLDCIDQELPALMRIAELERREKVLRTLPKKIPSLEVLESKLSKLKKQAEELEAAEREARAKYDKIPKWEAERKENSGLYQTEAQRDKARELEKRMTNARQALSEAVPALRTVRMKMTKLINQIRSIKELDTLKSSICASCQSNVSEPVLCGHCFKVAYCNQQCADNHWNEHVV